VALIDTTSRHINNEMTYYKEIKIAGLSVTLCYCYAVELMFRKASGVNIDAIDIGDPDHLVALIVASAVAYATYSGAECPISSEQLMYDASPEDIIGAVSCVMSLREQWYNTESLGKKKVKEKKKATS
jgi:hypothetical protein